MTAYTCKYTPVEIFAGFDEKCVLLNKAADNFEYSQAIMHQNMCSHVKAITEEIRKNKTENFIFVNCCDSLRRAYDVMKSQIDGFVFFMDLPHSDSSYAVKLFKAELLRLIDDFEKYSGKKFDIEKFLKSFTANNTDNSSDYIAVIGARCEDALINNVRSASPISVRDLTCAENREVKTPNGKENSLDSVISEYAKALLSQIPCMRMTDISGRKSLINDEKIKGIIYHTVKFCDYYDFEYKNLIKETALPIIKIETDYTKQSAGQLSTRLEAYFEAMKKDLPNESNPVLRKGKYFAGIDSGSTTTNLVVIDSNCNTVASAIVRTGFNAKAGAQKALEQSGIDINDISYLVATGYGRKNIPFANENVTEITCHAKGAAFLCPDADIIIDIGGQDSKVISLGSAGEVTNFVMNDKCAAGTGRFLENMARVIEMNIEDMAKRGLSYNEELNISSMCTVFAESEVVSLIAENKSIDDIIHALNKSVAVKISSLAGRAATKGKAVMTGGVARNPGVVREIEKQLSQSIYVPENPDLCGALGAALIALNRK